MIGQITVGLTQSGFALAASSLFVGNLLAGGAADDLQRRFLFAEGTLAMTVEAVRDADGAFSSAGSKSSAQVPGDPSG
jgi:hypothetical protein